MILSNETQIIFFYCSNPVLHFAFCSAICSTTSLCCGNSIYPKNTLSRNVNGWSASIHNTSLLLYDLKTGQLEGYDVEIARDFAAELGVEAVFDRDSASFNDLVRRAGAGDFDIAIGKLGTTYKRMSDAHPHEYMNFRHAILSNRKSIAAIQGNIPDEEFAAVLLDSKMRIGFIANSRMTHSLKDTFQMLNVLGLRIGPSVKRHCLTEKLMVFIEMQLKSKRLSIKLLPCLWIMFLFCLKM